MDLRCLGIDTVPYVQDSICSCIHIAIPLASIFMYATCIRFKPIENIFFVSQVFQMWWFTDNGLSCRQCSVEMINELHEVLINNQMMLSNVSNPMPPSSIMTKTMHTIINGNLKMAELRKYVIICGFEDTQWCAILLQSICSCPENPTFNSFTDMNQKDVSIPQFSCCRASM